MIINVVAAVISKNEDKKVLIAKRHNNKWEFPGGKIEKDETPEKALERELFEEFEINTKIKEFICSNKHEYEHIHINLLAYKVELITDKFILNNHKEIKWVSLDDLLKYDFSDADIPIVKFIKTKKI